MSGPRPPASLPREDLLPDGHPLKEILQVMEFQKLAGRSDPENKDRLGLDWIGCGIDLATKFKFLFVRHDLTHQKGINQLFAFFFMSASALARCQSGIISEEHVTGFRFPV